MLISGSVVIWKTLLIHSKRSAPYRSHRVYQEEAVISAHKGHDTLLFSNPIYVCGVTVFGLKGPILLVAEFSDAI